MSPVATRSKQTDPQPEPAKKKARRTGKSLHVWINPSLRDTLDRMAERSRRSVTTEVEIALEEYLAKQGLWPSK